jgi:ferredoxin-type protein NapG
MIERRCVLINTLRGFGLAAVGGALWGGFVHRAKAAPLILRPPGALPEKEFLAKCIKCGICVEDCPFDTLILAKPGDQRPIGTPYFIPRKKPCYMCRDIPCNQGCPTGALDTSLVSERDQEGTVRLDINRAKMGLAVIDRETCIAYWGMQCDVCYRACPLIDKAIEVEFTRNERTGKHAYLAPVVKSEYCTGCGLCEHACITEKASIFVLPREIAKGRSNTRYLRGWDKEDEKRLEDVPKETITKTPKSEQSPTDYLNQDNF